MSRCKTTTILIFIHFHARKMEMVRPEGAGGGRNGQICRVKANLAFAVLWPGADSWKAQPNEDHT